MTAATVGPIAGQDALLRAARAGDEDAYRRLVEPHRRELHAHCYRMLGSVHDAEDALQDAFLRAWRGLTAFAGRSSLRSWLYRIATNACLDVVARRPKRVLPLDHGPMAGVGGPVGEPLVESVWIEPYPDERLGVEDGLAAPAARYEQRESVELAFVAALQHLPPRQRAVLILREVLGFSARETAEALETTVASVNSALQRARRHAEEDFPAQSQQATLRALGDEQLRTIVEGYMEALEHADVDALVALLTEDATWSMPPFTSWYRGRAAIVAFLEDGPFRVTWRHVATRANGQLAVGCYILDAARDVYVAAVLDVLTLDGARISDVTGFVGEQDFKGHPAFARFGLPDELPA